MNIFHINSYYSVGKFYKNLYDLQFKSGKKLLVYIPISYKFNSSFDYGEYSQLSKVFNKFDRYIFHLKHKKILDDSKKRFSIDEFDVIHAHSLFSNGYIAMKLREEFGIPYVVAVRNTDVNVFFKKMIHLRNLGVRILENADKIVFLSSSYKNYVIDHYVPKTIQHSIQIKSIVIPNGIDQFWMDNKGEPKSIKNPQNINLIFVGSVDSNKNIEAVINACDLLLTQNIQVQLTVIGKPENEKIVKIMGTKKYITYYNYMAKEDLIEHYRKCDIFVMPSKFETFGLVYAEAMSQGLPLIYTKGQGFDGQFEDGTVGFAVEANNISDIALKIKVIMANYNEYSKKSILNVDSFKWENLELKYSLLYEELKVNNS